MWLVLLLPSWLPAIGWERIVQSDGVMYRLGLDWPWVTHLIMGPFGVVLLLGLRSRAVHLPGGHGAAWPGSARSSRTRPGCTAQAGPPALRLIWPDAGAGHLVGAGDRLRRVDQRLRRRRDACVQLELLAGDLPALRGDQQLPAELPDRCGDGHGCWSPRWPSRWRCRPERCAGVRIRCCPVAPGRRSGAG